MELRRENVWVEMQIWAWSDENEIAETACEEWEEEEAQDRSFRNTYVEDKEEATKKIGK